MTKNDTKGLHYPAPIRYTLSGVDKYWEESMGDDLSVFQDMLKSEELSLHEIAMKMCHYSTFITVLNLLGLNATSENNGLLLNFLGYLRWKWTNSPLFEVDDELNTLLQHSDIGTHCPCHYFRLPYSQMYIEFGKKRNMDIELQLSPGDRYPIEGVMLSERLISPHQLQLPDSVKLKLKITQDNIRYFEIAVTGSPIGRASRSSDSIKTIPIIITNEDESVETLVDRHMKYMSSPRNDITPMTDYDFNFYKTIIEHLAKVLLYLNSSAKRTEYYPDRTDVLNKIKVTKSKSKQAKLERKAQRVVDRYIVSSHWRRGHFRNQSYGVGRANHKVIWILPTLIGAGDIGIKDYEVKS